MELEDGHLDQAEHGVNVPVLDLVELFAELLVTALAGAVRVHHPEEDIQVIHLDVHTHEEFPEFLAVVPGVRELLDFDGARVVLIQILADLLQLVLLVLVLDLLLHGLELEVLVPGVLQPLEDDRHDQVQEPEDNGDHGAAEDHGGPGLRLDDGDVQRAPAIARDQLLPDREVRVQDAAVGPGAPLAAQGLVVDGDDDWVDELDQHDRPQRRQHEEHAEPEEQRLDQAVEAAQHQVELLKGDQHSDQPHHPQHPDDPHELEAARVGGVANPATNHHEDIQPVPVVL
mmetsp:Transcript_94588/g.204207  ORF Transcript_94588/g.204207 Transcript_94588/m.204207 type:complete len:286 (-) Transcript_94588:209-1066(-)